VGFLLSRSPWRSGISTRVSAAGVVGSGLCGRMYALSGLFLGTLRSCVFRGGRWRGWGRRRRRRRGRCGCRLSHPRGSTSSSLGLDAGISHGAASRVLLQMYSLYRMCIGIGDLWCFAWGPWGDYLVGGDDLAFLLEGC
jgi:hypothetical protein